METNRKETVVIMGSGLAGMSAAKMLADGAQRPRRIILIGSSFAPVPQSGHPHILLGKGQQLIAQHFPDVYRQMASHCPLVNWGDETYWRAPAGALPQRRLDISTHLLSRAYLDELLLDDLRKQSDCEFIEGTVTGLGLSEDQSRVNSVSLTDRKIDCDICIDCTGRSSKTRHMLELLFSETVKSEEVKTSLKYYTTEARWKNSKRFLKPQPSQEARVYQQAYFQIDPQNERYGALITPIENNKLLATFITVDKSFRREGNPFGLIDDEVFQKFVRELEFDPEYSAFGQLHNRLYHFEKYVSLPRNLFLIGDSVCCFNPVFGQGMTVALESAELLRDHLVKSGSRSLAFQRKLVKLIQFPWAIATMDPYNPESTAGLRQKMTRAFMHRMIRKSQSLASGADTHQALVEVLHMQKSPVKLIAPRYFL